MALFTKGKVDMSEKLCKGKQYTDNDVITHFPIVCFGFQKSHLPCKYLRECCEEHIKPMITERKWKNFCKKRGWL